MYPGFGYIGSKLKLLPFLQNSIETYTEKKLNECESFLDGCAGTGSVSYMMLSNGCKKVISNDIMYYSFVTSSVLTKNNLDIIKLKNIIIELNTINCNNPDELDFIYSNYTPVNNVCERMYLTNSNGIKVDRIRKHIDCLKDQLTLHEYYCLIKLLLYAVTKVSNTASVYGAYLKQFKETSKKELMLDPTLIDKLIENGVVNSFNEDINKLLLNIDYVEICYIDPPYNCRGYDSNYHLLETIAKYDSPIIKGKTGLRQDSKCKSKFCSKREIKNEFETLLKNVKSKYIFISYSSESLVSKEDMITIMEKYTNNIICYEKNYQRFKSNNNIEQDSTIIEYLFAGTLLK